MGKVIAFKRKEAKEQCPQIPEGASYEEVMAAFLNFLNKVNERLNKIDVAISRE